MNKKIKQIISHPFFSGSLVMVIGSNFYNLGQFIYHFLTARFLESVHGGVLGKTYYGDFTAVISILGLVGIIQLALGLTIVKFIASEKKEEELANFIKWTNWWSIWLGAILGGTLLILSPQISTFFKISQPATIYLLSVTLFTLVVVTSQRSILQGLLKFNQYILSLMTESVIKIILTVVLVATGFAVFGAITGLLVGVIASFIITRFSLLQYLKGKRGKRPELKTLFKYSLPVFLQGAALTSMYSTDFLLVKHFFSPTDAGIYASLSILGRIVFFGASPVTQVMFPLIVKQYTNKKPYKNILGLSLLWVISISLMLILIYRLFPSIPITLLYGNSYIEGSSLLWLMGVFMMLLALATVLTQFYLAIGKVKVSIFFISAAILQAILIWLYHPNLITVIHMSILSSALLDLGLIVYFLYQQWGKEKKYYQ